MENDDIGEFVIPEKDIVVIEIPKTTLLQVGQVKAVRKIRICELTSRNTDIFEELLNNSISLDTFVSL